MKTVIEMARDQGLPETEVAGVFIVNQDDLEAFAELVRADERERYKWDVHSCGPTCTKVACVAVREAVKAEREACAKVCEEYETNNDITATWLNIVAEAIRTRSNT